MLADRVRMGSGTKRKIEVTIHTSNFEYLKIYVGDGTLDKLGNPDYLSADTLIYTTNGDETVTLIVEEGSYITVSYKSIYDFDFSYYYTSLDSTIIGLVDRPFGGNIHITESMEIYYESVRD